MGAMKQLYQEFLDLGIKEEQIPAEYDRWVKLAGLNRPYTRQEELKLESEFMTQTLLRYNKHTKEQING
jgi:hypothetical protein|tara:strand:- start:11343 stop:11549 length:207 start_codon:yes stop_codon:yes gene_type:complete